MIFKLTHHGLHINMYGTWISSKFIETFGPKRNYDDPLKQHHKDIAAALQNRIEEIIIHHLKNAKKEFGLKKLCLAGGVGLNCSLNGKIIKEKIFDEIFVQPASGDNGAAIGACFLAHQELTGTLEPKKYHDFYLGSSFTDHEIESLLKSRNIIFEKSENIFLKVASELYDKKIIGWFQKSAEFGPRALGNRSILTSPFPKENMADKVGFMDSFCNKNVPVDSCKATIVHLHK